MFSSANVYVDSSSARNYSDNNDVQFNMAKNFIDQHGALIKGPVLDLGSGDGKVTAYIAKKIGVPITGFDISEDRVNLANQTYGTENISFEVRNISCLDDARQFGTIVSFNTLHHIPSTQQASIFSQTRNLLLRNGIGLFLIPGRSQELHDAIQEVSQHEKWKSFFEDFNLADVRTYETAEYYKVQCRAAGFYHCDVTATLDPGGKELDPEGMKNFLAGWLPHLVHLRLKNENENKFLDDIVALYFKKMNKGLHETVNPVIAQNKVVAFRSEASFFHRARVRNQFSPISSVPVELDEQDELDVGRALSFMKI